MVISPTSRRRTLKLPTPMTVPAMTMLHAPRVFPAPKFVLAILLFAIVPLPPAVSQDDSADDGPPLAFEIERTTAGSGFDGEMCWVHARAGSIPPGTEANPADTPVVVMTMQKLLLSGSDVFYGLNERRTDDLGESWDGPTPHETLARRDDIGDSPLHGEAVALSDFTPKWHAASGVLLGTGHNVRYRDNRVMHARLRDVGFSVYDPQARSWTRWATMAMPDEPRFANAGAGSTQRFDLPNGDILLPISFKEPHDRNAISTVVRCRFDPDGPALRYVEHGDEMTTDVPRGFGEPSLTRFGDRFFLTLRNDEHGHVTAGDDGLHFDEPRRWRFDDGELLGNYNTQQHWVTHADGLFLVYTRRGANNDHVFRHRAPLFIARIDPQRLVVLRETERVLIPERGARLGNFGVVDVSPAETWVIAAEWMQPKGVERHGSDNTVWVVKLRWNRPNPLVPGGPLTLDGPLPKGGA